MTPDKRPPLISPKALLFSAAGAAVAASSLAAPHSTGPRTEAGKAISSQNALRHGLTSSCLVLPWENKADFEGMLNDLVAEHQPATITEQIMVREMAENYWRLNRCRTEEHRLLSQAREIFAEAERERDNGIFLDWQRCVDLSQLYATRFERNFHKSFRPPAHAPERTPRQRSRSARGKASASRTASPSRGILSQRDRGGVRFAKTKHYLGTARYYTRSRPFPH